MTQHTLSLGPLTLLASQQGPLMDVSIRSHGGVTLGGMSINTEQWDVAGGAGGM